MKTRIKLSSILPHLEDQFQELITQTLKSSGLGIADAELKRAGLSDDDMKLEEGSRSIIHRVSTRDVDRDGEVVMPSGIDLKDYMKNPVVLWGHNYKEPQIGSDEWIKVDDSGYALVAKTVYASTPRAMEVWTLRKEGHLKTSSIGFVPVEIIRSNDAGFLKMVDKCTADWPEFKKQRDRCQAFVKRAILLEHSDVPIPCNPNALTIATAKGMNLSPEMQDALGIKPEGCNGVITLSHELIAELMGVTAEQVNEKSFTDWIKAKITKQPKPAIKPVIKVISVQADSIKVVSKPTITVLAAETLSEKVKNLVDLKLGKV